MRFSLPFAFACAVFALPAVTASHAAGAALRANETRDVVALVAVDSATREATLRTLNGEAIAMTLPSYARLLARAKAGDLFAMRRVETESISLSHGCAPAVNEEQSLEPAFADGAAGVEVVRISRVAFCIQEVDPARRVIVIRDANDDASTLTLADAPAPLDRAAAGDTVTFVTRDALALVPIAAPSSQAGSNRRAP